jgi:arsenate reductase
MIKVYGIKNCNTVKKAIDWLNVNHVAYEFHDYKKLGITKDKLEEWSDHFGWENVLNKKGTTWNGLTDEQKQAATSKEGAISLLLQNTSAIKRPIIEAGNKYLIRFDEKQYADALVAT